MCMDFDAIICNLTRLSNSLNLEPDAKIYTGQILTTACELMIAFQNVITKDGSSILVQQTLFKNVRKSGSDSYIYTDAGTGEVYQRYRQEDADDDVNLYEEKNKKHVLFSLNVTSDKLSLIQNAVFALQSNVSSHIISFQKRKKEKDTYIEKIVQDIKAFVTEIQVIDVHIATYEPDIVIIGTNVDKLETEAEDTKKTHKLVLLLNMAVFLVGVSYRKCRGYWLVGVTTVGIVHAAVHLYDVNRSANITRDLRNTVQLIRDRIERLWENNSTLQKQLATHEEELKNFKVETERLDTTITCLEQLKSILSTVTKVIEFDLYMIQTLRDELSGMLSGRQRNQPGRLKALFEMFEKLLVPHGVPVKT